MKAIIVVGLGFGDEGKGTIVDALVRNYDSELVVRFNGGFQAAHNVYTELGQIHTFSQFGSGTLAGAKTLIGPDVIINPLCMQVEETALGYNGIKNALKMVIVHGNCLVTTPFHKALNQVRELSRKVAHGSTGTGIGETIRASLAMKPCDVLRAHDLEDMPVTYDKLFYIRKYAETLCRELIHDYSLKGPLLESAMDSFCGVNNMTMLMARYRDWANSVDICDYRTRFENILRSSDKPVIFEGAQGVLLDKTYGFHPYTTWSDTTDRLAYSMLRDSDTHYTIGVTRTFMTRHGAGPMVSEHSADLGLVDDDDNLPGQFQGKLRTGYLDLVALKYAIRCCQQIDGIALTHCDKLGKLGTHLVCAEYKGANLLNYRGVEASTEAFDFTKQLKETSSVYAAVEPALFAKIVEMELKVPVVIQSHGKMQKHKTFMGLQTDDDLVVPSKADLVKDLTTDPKVETQAPAPETQHTDTAAAPTTETATPITV